MFAWFGAAWGHFHAIVLRSLRVILCNVTGAEYFAGFGTSGEGEGIDIFIIDICIFRMEKEQIVFFFQLLL